MDKQDKSHGYGALVAEASLPLADRDTIVTGRGGAERVPRKYHLSDTQLEALIARVMKNECFIPPYRAGQSYWSICQSLANLGINKRHSFADILGVAQEIMSDEGTRRSGSGMTAWDRFISRKSRSEHNARDPEVKFLENIEVLQRLHGSHPYGLKLLQVGALINLYDVENGFEAELRVGVIGAVVPTNTRRKQRQTGLVDIRNIGVPYCILDSGLSVVETNISIPEVVKE